MNPNFTGASKLPFDLPFDTNELDSCKRGSNSS